MFYKFRPSNAQSMLKEAAAGQCGQRGPPLTRRALASPAQHKLGNLGPCGLLRHGQHHRRRIRSSHAPDGGDVGRSSHRTGTGTGGSRPDTREELRDHVGRQGLDPDQQSGDNLLASANKRSLSRLGRLNKAAWLRRRMSGSAGYTSNAA